MKQWDLAIHVPVRRLAVERSDYAQQQAPVGYRGSIVAQEHIAWMNEWRGSLRDCILAIRTPCPAVFYEARQGCGLSKDLALDRLPIWVDAPFLPGFASLNSH